MLYDRRDFGLLRLAGAYQWLPLAPLRALSPLKQLSWEASLLSILGLLTFSRNGEYLSLSPEGYQFLSAFDLSFQPPSKRPYSNSAALRRRLEVGSILFTCLSAGIEPALEKVEHLKHQPVFLPAFTLRTGDGNLMNAAGCAGFGHWGGMAYMVQYVSEHSTGFFMNNELSHLHNLATIFSERLDTPQALILAGENYLAIYKILTRTTPSERNGKKAYVDYSQAYPRLGIPACLLSCDDTGALQLAIMRQTDYRPRIAQAAFGARWKAEDDRLPEADGHVDGNPLVIALDMDLRRLDRICRDARQQGRKEILVAALEGQMSAFLKAEGYDVRMFNLLDMENSDAWNCLSEIEHNKDLVQSIAEVIIKNTSNANERQDFWEKAELNLLMALMHYVASQTVPGTKELLPIQQRSLGAIYRMLSNESFADLERRFEALPKGHPALAPYGIFKLANRQIWGNIAIGLGNRLSVFQNPLVDKITSYDAAVFPSLHLHPDLQPNQEQHPAGPDAPGWTTGSAWCCCGVKSPCACIKSSRTNIPALDSCEMCGYPTIPPLAAGRGEACSVAHRAERGRLA